VKRTFSGLIIVSLFIILLPSSKVAASGGNIQPLAGIVISNISPESFNLKYPDIPIGLCKVGDPVSLSNNEMYAMSHNIPLYTSVNLFYYAFSSSAPADLNDLKSYYGKIPQEDLQEKDRVESLMLYGVRKNGNILSYSEKKEPEIEITYKTISSRKGPTIIPERHVKFSNEIVTYFLLDPFGKPEKVRMNPFEVTKIYDINPSFYNTLVVRNQNENKNVDFSGFYVDVPDKFVSQNYFDIERTSLGKFSSYIHSTGKSLIVENLIEETLPLGEFGDIIGVKVDGNTFDILEKTRLQFTNKTIFATYNGDFSNSQNIQNFLNQCILYGIYPEFLRDASTGEFLYYENYFAQNGKIIKDAIDKISLLNKATFTKESLVNDARIVQFGKYPFVFFVISYNGELKLNLEKSLFNNNSDFTMLDYNNNSVNFTIKDNSISMDISLAGIKVLRVVPDGFYPIYLGTFLMNSSNAGSNSSFINIGDSSGSIDVQFNLKGRKQNETLSLKPLSEQSFYNTGMPTSILVNGIGYQIPQRLQPLNINVILLFVFSAFFLFLLFYKEFKIKNYISSKLFILLSILLPIILILINSMLIHYASITIVFFTFSLLFLVTAFYRSDNFKNLLIISVLLFLMGMFYNYFEFGTLLPQAFNGLLPFKLYENFFFYLPFVFSLLFFQIREERRIIKLELIFVILTLGIILFYFDNLSLPFEFELQLKSLYPMFSLFVGNIVLQTLNKPFKWSRVILSIVSLVIVFISIPFSKLSFSAAFLNPKFINLSLILKDFLIYSIPFFFVSLYLYNVDKQTIEVSFGKLVFTIFGILVFYNYLLQYFVKRGNPIFLSIGFIVNPILIILMFVVLLD